MALHLRHLGHGHGLDDHGVSLCARRNIELTSPMLGLSIESVSINYHSNMFIRSCDCMCDSMHVSMDYLVASCLHE